MAVGVVAREPVTGTRRAAPLVAAAASAGGAGFLFTHNPVGSGVHYPGCVFRQATGLWCPGCGLTRGCYELLHGHVGAAISSNLFTPLAVAAIIGGWLSWLRWAWTGAGIHVPARLQRIALIALPMLLVIYGVLRNIPSAPFRALAP